MARVIRSHKDQLTTAHQGLKTRHQFKLGVLSELRQDPNIAHKHYTQAYLALDEIRIIDNNCLEIKTVAGYINYKLCRTMFQLNLPRDAISQFKSHIERYKTRIGCRELEFEHYSWLSAQYFAFAELFNEAVDKGLPAIQTQHPGYYYQDAARHSILRRKSIAILAPNISKELQ
ncbi:trafficking protein particle complex subunit 11-like, partial [Ctenocephalides felis]